MSSAKQKTPLALDFKSATLYAVRVVLHSADTAQWSAALEQRMTDAGSFFENEPVVIDASALDASPDWAELVSALTRHQLEPIGMVGNDEQVSSAAAHGLKPVDLSSAPVRQAPPPAPEQDVPPVASKPAPSKTSTAVSTTTAAAPAPAAMVVNRPLRSGQRIYARGTDLIVIGMVSQGAEVIADGNIHVYGPLRGKAMAGARGDAQARIFTTCFEAELVAVAGVYRVIEGAPDAAVHQHPALVQLQDETLQIVPLGAKA